MNPATLIPLIQGSISIILSLIEWVTKISTALKQNAEMTPEQEQALDLAIAQLRQQPWWIPETPPQPPV